VYVRLLAVALLAAGAALAGCSNSTDNPRADTIGASGPVSATVGVPTAARRAATVAELRAALPTIRDLPTGYALDTAKDAASTDTVDQPRCKSIIDGLDKREQGDPAAAAKISVTYRTGGAFGSSLSADVRGYRDPRTPSASLAAIGTAFNACPTFTTRSAKDGTETTYRLAALSFPLLGDQTVAYRLNASTQGFDLTADLVYTRVGQCTVSVVNGGLMTLDPAALERVARATVSRLEKVC
jgi:hypothetical protein